jgi:DnaJ-domain-containing protein 1
MNPGAKQHKVKVEVELELDDGTRTLATMFVAAYQRVVDVLNDDRQFLPVTGPEGVSLINKKTIRRVVPFAQQVDPERRSESPYRVLGVTDGIGDDALREAYLAMTRANHPDKLRGLGLPDDFVDLATRKMAVINDAYQRIRRQRQGARAEAAAS